MPAVSYLRLEPRHWAALFAAVYIGVLSMSSTIALRNLALAGLLLVVVWQLYVVRPGLRPGWPLLLWAAYVLFFPLFASDHIVALQSLSGQWGRTLLAMLAGAGLAFVLQRGGWGTVFQLGVASSVPFLIHLLILGWKSVQTGAIQWGDWGRELHHADLGYAAGQATILMAVAIVTGSNRWRILGFLFIVAALLSTTLARSRAGLAFAVFGGMLVFVSVLIRDRSRLGRSVFVVFLSTLLVATCVFVLAVKDDTRWHLMVHKVSAGFLGNAMQLLCEGTASVEPAIQRLSDDQRVTDEIIAAVRDGDGSRMHALRVGLELSWKHPFGSDGSRQAFRRLLELECGAVPVGIIAHAHNGWIDMLLAIGWIGAFLYLLLLLSFLRLGIAGLRSRQSDTEPWGLVLVAVSVFWIVRGMTDSVYRDHMLEMQGFLLAYAAVMLRLSGLTRIPPNSPVR